MTILADLLLLVAAGLVLGGLWLLHPGLLLIGLGAGAAAAAYGVNEYALARQKQGES